MTTPPSSTESQQQQQHSRRRGRESSSSNNNNNNNSCSNRNPPHNDTTTTSSGSTPAEPRRGCGDSKVWHQLSQSILHLFAVGGRNHNHDRIRPSPPTTTTTRRHHRHLLRGCETLHEHCERIQQALDAVQDLHGKEGLEVLQFEYRWMPCEACCNNAAVTNPNIIATSTSPVLLTKTTMEESPATSALVMESSVRSLDGSSSTTATDEAAAIEGVDDDDVKDEEEMLDTKESCRHCAQRLFHGETTLITEQNRKDYIADGKMYEEVCRLAQEYAQDSLAQLADLEWQDVPDTEEKDKEPMRVLVSRSGDDTRPLLVVCTGRGKVRAGIFSRHHLLCTGLEIGTAFHTVQAAAASGYRLALIDPNVHGEAQGYVTFCHSLRYILQSQAPQQPPDFLLHSASGGHFVRYLLDTKTPDDSILPRRVAFTDSTHNIQWAAATRCSSPNLAVYLQSPAVVYFRSSRPDDSMWHLHAAGQPCPVDKFWKHRFGSIVTKWAGTNQHALTNWSAHEPIWEHFLVGMGERVDIGLAISN